ncbi:MAG: dTMP kinase [Bacteroidales bacterium]|nr:dTMP kinase [Bacteroidales bacterium]
MFIVLEGLDGAGKSTQVKMLRSYLDSRTGGRLDYIHFPRYDAPVYGDLISRFLRGEFGANDQVHPQLVALLFAEDRHGAGPIIRESLGKGRTVLLDRYVYSNIAYQCAKLESAAEADALRDWILQTEFGDFSLPRPDLNIFLDVPIGFVEKSLGADRGERAYLDGGRDIHEASIEFQKKVRDRYLAEKDGVTVVDCSDTDGGMLDPQSIFGKIKSLIDGRL